MKKILYIFDASDWESRIEVAHGAQKKGYDIVIGLINGKEDIAAKFPEFKITHLKKSNNSIGVLSSLHMVKDISDLIKQEEPHIIHAVTLKYAFMCGLAALPFSKEIRKIYTLAGLGYLFRSHDKKSVMLRNILRPILTFILRRQNTTLIFQNQDDLDLMVAGKYARRENTILIKGSGVYLDRFTPAPSNEGEKEPIVLMPTRLVHDKGVNIFIEAARILKQRGIEAKFQIAGGETKHNPRAISKAQMLEMLKGGEVEWLGRVNDLPERLSHASLIVYPSHYGEGVPRVLLEACAAGRAIVTTDHAGCKEAVKDGVSGLLVPVRDAHKTADAMEELLNNHEKRISMELESRKLAEEEFDIHIIAKKTLAVYS